MDKRSRCGRLVGGLACGLWLLVAVKLTTGASCPDKIPNGCACVDQPFAVSCIKKNLTVIPDGLPPAPSLTITDNNIVTLTSIKYTGLINLILSNNNITILHGSPFQQLISLTKLILSSNKITTINAYTFAGLASLTTLVLHDNPVFYIKTTMFVFANLPKLSSLKLSQCQIYEVGENAFSSLNNLQDLNMSSNHITSLTAVLGSKHVPINLVTLDASHNRMAAIRNGDFHPVIHLNTLKLSNNNIMTISDKDFYGLHNNLTVLDLSHNKLSTISSGAFKYMEALEMLSLQFNFLNTLDESAIPWRKEAPIVLVHNNPWRCDCSMKWLYERKFASKWNINGSTKCAAPKDVAGEDVFKTEHGVFHHCYHSVSAAVVIVIVFFSLLAVAVIGVVIYRRYCRGRLRAMTSQPADKEVLSPPYRRV